MQPKKGPTRCPKTSVRNYQSFSVFEGVSGGEVTSKICDIRLQKLQQIENDCCSNWDISPAVKFFFYCGIRHRAVCRRHKSDCSLKLARFMWGNVSAASGMAIESEHVKQAKRLTSRPARPLLAVTIPWILKQQRQIHIRDLHSNWNDSMTHRKKPDWLPYQHGKKVFLESLQLLSSVGRFSYDMRFKSVKTWSSVLSTWGSMFFTGSGIARLHPQSPRYFVRQPSVPVSQTLRPSCISHVIKAAT